MSESPSHPHLIVLSGAHKGDVIVLDDALPVVFGTRTGVVLKDPAMDPVHCQVMQADGRWFLQDFGSAEGTWLGDERVEGLRPLEFGRSFRIGETHIALLQAEAEAPEVVLEPLDASELPTQVDDDTNLVKRKRKRNISERTQILDLDLPLPDDFETPTGLPDAPALVAHDSLGDYDILDLLGDGALGRVYKGYDRRRRRVVAVKVLDSGLAQDPHAVARFLRGAKAGGRLSHRHIVKVLAAGHAAGRIYVTMEFVDGLNLEQFCLASGGRLDPKVALGIMNRITDALVYAHSKKVLHRNVTPRNIMVGPGGFPKLADLALAKRLSKKESSDTGITSDGQVLARSAYSPPEGLLGSALDERSDVYGVGVTLYRILTGEPPYGHNPKEVTQRSVKGDMTDPTTLRRRLSPELCALLKKALHPSPEQRFAKMRDLREGLADLPEVG